jgi:hypothetical protein
MEPVHASPMDRGQPLRSSWSLTGLLGTVLREPLVPFVLLGGAIFAAYALAQGSPPDVRFTPETAAALATEHEALTGRAPTAAERARMRDQFITDELLFREAIDRGLHLTDGPTKARMIERMRYTVTGMPPEPSEEELINHYSENIARYQAEPKITFEQRFFARRPDNPSVTLDQLNRGERVAGDDFWLGRSFPDYGHSMIRGIFGQPMVTALLEAPKGQWIGPLESARGFHFLRKDATAPARQLPYAAIREQVKQDYLTAYTQAAIDREVVRLKAKYDVEIVP